MKYRNNETGEIVRDVLIPSTAIQRLIVEGFLIPSSSLRESVTSGLIAALGYTEVATAAQPKDINNRVVSEGDVVEIDGVYTQTWDIDDSGVDLFRDVEDNCTKMLDASAYTLEPDSELSVTDKNAWATYRQELRDLPATYASNPEDVVWPVAPVLALQQPND